METEISSTKIEKLTNTNYYTWKIRIVHILTLKDLEHFLDEDIPRSATPEEHTKWIKGDKKAQAIIGLTLSNDLLENVREVETAKEMWKAIKNVFERHTLLNKLSARKKFYTARKSPEESILQFANRIRLLAATLKSMNVVISGSEMAMALLNGLPEEYNALISALDAIDEDESELDFDFIKSRIMQEEQRISIRNKSALAKSEAAALLAAQNAAKSQASPSFSRLPRRRPFCNFCKRLGHVEAKCYTKFPHLAPRPRNASPSIPALVVNKSDEDPVVCLIAQQKPVNNNQASCLLTKYENAEEPTNSDKWFIDSGCSNHMTYNKSLFESYTAGHPASVDFGNNNSAEVAGTGNVKIDICVNGKQVKCVLQNVLHVPELGYQLLSVPTFDKSGFNTSFYSRRCQITKGSQLLATATMKGNLYELDISTSTSGKALVAVNSRLWHYRFAHLHSDALAKMASSNTVRGLQVAGSNEFQDVCSGCVLGKGRRSNIPKKSSNQSTKLLELVHSDVNGPIEVPSLGGSRYFITFIDDFSRWISLYTMKQKSDTFDCFKRYHTYVEKQIGSKIKSINVIKRTYKTVDELKALRTDNGGEYLSNEFKSYLEKHGIQHQLTIAYTPQQNGVAERMNRTLMDVVRSLLQTAQLDKKFWAEALSTAVYIRNRVVSRSLPNNVTPYHRWYGKTPDVSHFRVFGCKCWYVLPKTRVRKLDARSKRGLMMGYSTQSKGYKIWDIESSKLLVSRDVTFDENSVSENSIPIAGKDLESSNFADQGGEAKEDMTDNINLASKDPIDNCADQGVSASNQINSNEGDEGNNDEDFVDAQTTPEPVLRRSDRIRKKTGEWWKATSLVSQAVPLQEVPKSYKAATTPENISFWKPGIDKEHDCLIKNRTWLLVDYQPGMKVLPCKYVFKVKEMNSKVRLVALGNLQMHGVDYNETFAPVVTIITIRAIFAISAALDLEIEQMDVVTAFLNGDLKEEIYMEIPEGLRNHTNTKKVCKLMKSLYGLKQSPRMWYFKMHEFLLGLGFESSQNDPCLYVRHSTAGVLLIGLYVDDLLIAGSSRSEIALIKKKLSQRFEMKDMGTAKVILGIEVSRDRQKKKLFINQAEYTRSVLERFGMIDSKPVATPMDRSYHDNVTQESAVVDNVPYRQVIGSLMYLMITTRPDIAYAIGKLSQRNQNPRAHDWIAAKRVLRYINGTRDFGILYDHSKPQVISGYSDADWGGCKLSRKSTSGNVFLFAGGAISWRSKKQTCVATSTCEAEYIASCLATKESIWLARLFSDLCDLQSPPTVTIEIDNGGAINTANNASINQRNKHIDLQYHFVRECVQSNSVLLKYCPSDVQIADSLTKPLARVLFEKFRSLQGICPKPF